MSEEGKTADRLGDLAAQVYRRSRGELEPVRFTSQGRTLTPRELVYVVLHAPVSELTRYAEGLRAAMAHWIPVGAR
ncbi:MAG: hypothetical protein ACREJS_14110 [Candidatus Rokuibacteriota bacterium]